MKKIACCGYHYTGSGVIDDIFRECDNVYQGTYEAEIRLLQDADGVSDLEYHLVENPNRLSSSVAIKRFLSLVKSSSRQLQKIVGEDGLELCNEYAKSLVLIKYHGYGSGDVLFFTPFQKMQYYFHKILKKILRNRYTYPQDSNVVPSVISYYSRLTESEFLTKTRAFVEELCKIANKENKEYIMLDQFIGTGNPARYVRYVDDIKAIIVDRDPRDLYINRISQNDKVLPKDPHQFCIYYRNIRKTIGSIPKDKVMVVNFADMIYHYDEYVQKVFDFVEMDRSHHISPRTHFDPSISIRGTKMWERYPEYAEAVKIIEQELPEYLYEYN
jgi:hypothetical protein